MKILTFLFVAGLIVVSILAMGASQQPTSHQAKGSSPQLKAAPPLLFAKDYRQWVYLSSGLDMVYAGDPPAPNCKDENGKESPCPKMFENVFVRREAYDGFVKNRIWPAGTVFMLERRCSAQKVSIDTTGSTQGKLFLIAASQKTAENGWNYYVFTDKPTCVGPDPDFTGKHGQLMSNSTTDKDFCWQCHKDHGLKDNTFIQFYPTLKPLVAAKEK